MKHQDEGTCVICYEGPKNTYLSPCGHGDLCVTCARRIRLCPFCNSKITSLCDTLEAVASIANEKRTDTLRPALRKSMQAFRPKKKVARNPSHRQQGKIPAFFSRESKCEDSRTCSHGFRESCRVCGLLNKKRRLGESMGLNFPRKIPRKEKSEPDTSFGSLEGQRRRTSASPPTVIVIDD